MITVYISLLINENISTNFSTHLFNLLYYHGINVAFLDNTKDIWLRDFMPVQIGENNFVQFSLTKNYYSKKDRHKITYAAPICHKLGISPLIPTFNGNVIYLDGGNVILNPSRTKAIITEKVFDDNKIPSDILKGILRDVLQVEKVIFIPVEQDDDTGHADGMVRFVNDNMVVANDYNHVDFVTQDFKDRFYGELNRNGLDVIKAPYHPVNQRRNGLWVALGCYINYLQVGNKLFLPTFDNPAEDDHAQKRFGEIFGISNIIPVPAKEIAMGGGVLNCVSWEISAE